MRACYTRRGVLLLANRLPFYRRRLESQTVRLGRVCYVVIRRRGGSIFRDQMGLFPLDKNIPVCGAAIGLIARRLRYMTRSIFERCIEASQIVQPSSNWRSSILCRSQPLCNDTNICFLLQNMDAEVTGEGVERGGQLQPLLPAR